MEMIPLKARLKREPDGRRIMMENMRESEFLKRMIRTAIVIAAVTAMSAVIILNGGNGNIRQSELAESGQILLYGEMHGVEIMLKEEQRLWEKHYHEDGMRHLFVEYAYYDTAILNRWMQEADDDTLDEWMEGLKGTFGYSKLVKEFLKEVKKSCPETIFHGTDVGHQYDTTGRKYLEYLES